MKGREERNEGGNEGGKGGRKKEVNDFTVKKEEGRGDRVTIMTSFGTEERSGRIGWRETWKVGCLTRELCTIVNYHDSSAEVASVAALLLRFCEI